MKINNIIRLYVIGHSPLSPQYLGKKVKFAKLKIGLLKIYIYFQAVKYIKANIPAKTIHLRPLTS